MQSAMNFAGSRISQLIEFLIVSGSGEHLQSPPLSQGRAVAPNKGERPVGVIKPNEFEFPLTWGFMLLICSSTCGGVCVCRRLICVYLFACEAQDNNPLCFCYVM